MAQQPQYFVKEFLPRFDIPISAPSQSICSECCDHIPIIGSERHYCECRCHVYCKACWATKESMRTHRCTAILGKAQEVQDKLQAFGTWWGFDVHDFLINEAPGNLYEFSHDVEDRRLALHDVKAYFKAREELIKLLIDDAFTFRCGNSNVNTLALDIALVQCKDLFHLDKVDSNYFREEGICPKKEYLLSLLLFMGKFEEHYNVCCYYAQYGEQFFHSVHWYRTDCPLYEIYPVTEAKEKFEVDMTCSFLENYSLHHNHFPRLALNHMFIHKYVLHMNMENLRLLHLNFLDNEDCVSLIGEYIGMKKDWLKYEKNWYKNQALEVLKEFARSEKFEFGIIHGMSDKFLGSGKYKQIDTALKIGRGQLYCYRNNLKKKPRETVSDSWAIDTTNREGDVENLDFHGTYLAPLADLIVEKLNEIAGYSQFGANHFGRRMSATKFLTEVAEVCDKKAHGYFEEFLDFLDEHEYVSNVLLSCLVFERRLIQANFYEKHCYTEEDIQRIRMRVKKCKTVLAHDVLDKLPCELRPYSYGRPLPLLHGDPFLNFPMGVKGLSEEDEIKAVGGWLPDVTNVIDALFHADLATDENLDAIFDDSSMVSYRLYQLRKMREKKNQRSITSFFERKKPRHK